MNELTEGSYYLILKNKDNEIYEIKCERVSKECYFLKFLYPKDLSIWVKKYHIGSSFSDAYRFIEELDPTYYRKQKLERITEEEK